jgi:hypothetical protein
MNKTLSGSCLCGDIQYQCDAIDAKMANCHCTMCQKFHGAAFATFASVERAHFRWTKGKEVLKQYTANNGTVRQFCSNCGSSLSFSSPDQAKQYIEIAVASLDVKLDIKPDAHIFIDFKANWLDINDTLPQYPKNRPSQQTENE